MDLIKVKDFCSKDRIKKYTMRENENIKEINITVKFEQKVYRDISPNKIYGWQISLWSYAQHY